MPKIAIDLPSEQNMCQTLIGSDTFQMGSQTTRNLRSSSHTRAGFSENGA